MKKIKTLTLKGDNNFVKLINYLLQLEGKYSSIFKISNKKNINESYIRWDSIKNKFISYYLYVSSGDLKLKTYSLLKRINDEIIIEKFLIVDNDDELLKIFEFIKNKHIKEKKNNQYIKNNENIFENSDDEEDNIFNSEVDIKKENNEITPKDNAPIKKKRGRPAKNKAI